MSFFKKLFGNSKTTPAEIKPDIDSLLASNDTDKLIIDLHTYITKICDYGDSLEKLTEPQKTFYFNQQLETEINNGGFSQYFLNSSGSFAHQAIISLKQINAIKTADILQLAIDEFPNSFVSKDELERREIMEKIEDKAEEAWELLDEKFLTYEDNLYELNLQFIQQNRSFF
jgi:hypothetical protein